MTKNEGGDCTLTVDDTDCAVISVGIGYFGQPPSGGNDETDCATNQQVFLDEDGAIGCRPIPFASYTRMAACPAGYLLDAASEGQHCLPAS